MFPGSGMVCSARKGLCHPHQAPLSTPPTGAGLGTRTACWPGTAPPLGPPPRAPTGCGPGASLASTLAGGDRVFSLTGAGWGVGGGGWAGTRHLGLGRWQRLAGGGGWGGLGYITGLRLPGVGWRRRCSPTWEHLTQPSREAASHASWRLALGTACRRQLCSQPPPTHTQVALWLPWGSTQASPKVRRRKGCGRQLLGGSGDHKGHGRPCLGEGVRGAGPLVRLQGRPLPPPAKSASPALCQAAVEPREQDLAEPHSGGSSLTHAQMRNQSLRLLASEAQGGPSAGPTPLGAALREGVSRAGEGKASGA